MSPISKEDSSIIEKIAELIANSFEIPEIKKAELIDTYRSVPKIEGLFLMKGNCGVSIEKFKGEESILSLPSLLESLFQVLLSDEKEPILLMGSSSFKTFLSQLELPQARVITLNQESTVAQLLGSSSFLTDIEANVFYLQWICNICHIPKDKFNRFKEDLENNKLNQEMLETTIKDIKNRLPISFRAAIDQLTNKLFNKETSNHKETALDNITIEFRPGLFLSAILEGRSLILKNLHNLPTIILERFNELFSGKHNLTLNEDIHDTFTEKNKKEITDFSSNFRVFATCPPNSATKLSEAVLSRFSVIYTSEYSPDEQNKVLYSYIQRKDLRFKEDLVRLLTDFAELLKKSVKKVLTFTQMINIIEICSRINLTTNEENHINNLGIILYRIVSGLIENRKNEIIEKKTLRSF